MVNALYLLSEGELKLIAYDGQVIPEAGITLTGILDHDLNNDGGIVFLSALFKEGVGNTRGIFRFQSGQLDPLAIGGDTDGIGNRVSIPSMPRINDAGQVALIDRVRVSPSGYTVGNRIVLFDPDGTSTSIMGVDSQLGSLGVVSFFGGSGVAAFAMNDIGEQVIVTDVQSSVIASGLFLRSDGDVSKILLSGHKIGLLEISALERAEMNNSNDVVFLGTIKGDKGSKGEFLGLYRDHAVQVLCVGGEPVPGVDETTFAEIGDFRVNDSGWVVFSAKLAGNGPREGILVVQ